MACANCAPKQQGTRGDVTISLLSGLAMLLLTGACWGLVGFWVSTGACYPDEYQLFMGLWLGSLVAGICVIAFAWGGEAKLLAFLGLLMLYGWIMLWLELGHIVVSACPLADL
jgi:hypothetical protein